MTAAVLCVAVLAFLGLSAAAIVAILRHDRDWRASQPSWWRRPIEGAGLLSLRSAVRTADEPNPCEVEAISLRDPRVVSARVTKRKAVGQ